MVEAVVERAVEVDGCWPELWVPLLATKASILYTQAHYCHDNDWHSIYSSLRAESLRNIDIAMDEDTNIEQESEPCSFYVAGVPTVVFDTDPETSIKVSQSLLLHTARLTSLGVKLRKLTFSSFCVRASVPQPEFESIFKAYGEEVRFTYLKSFGRVRVTYPDPEQCRLAENNLSRQEFRGASLILKPVEVRKDIDPSL